MDAGAIILICLVICALIILAVKLGKRSGDSAGETYSGGMDPVDPPDPVVMPKKDTVDYLSGVTDTEYAASNRCRICSRCETMAPIGRDECPVCGKRLDS